MTALYSCELQGYGTFDVMTPIVPRTTDVMRFHVPPGQPPRCAARIYEFPLDGLVRAGTPAASVAALATLSSSVNTGTLPTSLKFKDSSGTVLPGIGDIREGTSAKWEDLELLAFELPPGVDQLVAGVRFKVTFRARRSFPDADGVCEYEASRKLEADDQGRAVRRLRCKIRLDKASVVAGTISVETTTAIRALLTEPKPSATWIRTMGTTDLPYTIDYTLHPLTHVAETESEVTKNVGGGGSPPGATHADIGERRVEDPSRGIVRVTTTADTDAPANSLPWVESQAPAGDLVSAETSVEGPQAKGEWKAVEALSGASGPTTRLHRRFALRGSGRSADATEMSGGIAARAQVGPFVAQRLLEEIDVYAKGPLSLEQVAIPPPLGGGWALDGRSVTDAIGVAEDAKAASQRLWLRTVKREYLWLGTGDPLASSELNAAIAASMAEAL